MDRGRHAVGPAGGRIADRPDRGREVRLPAAPRPRPSPAAGRDQLSRQCGRAEARRLHRSLAISAVGSLREELAPGRFVLVDQYLDRTHGRASSFFGPGFVAHVSMADPVCPRLSALAADAAEAAGAPVTRGGCYVAINGPQFSTRAESAAWRTAGGDVIGMTGMPEAKLAREAELPYASVCMVTDYDCWREGEAVDAATILAALHANAETARRLIVELAKALPRERAPSPIDTNLDHAIVTAPEARDPAMLAKLDAVCRRLRA